MEAERAKALRLIRRNIDEHGFHIYVVSGGPLPRYAYTIGLRDSLGAELVLAGALFYQASEDVIAILHGVRKQLSTAKPKKLGAKFEGAFTIRRFGAFTLNRVHAGWTRALLSGAVDYHGTEDVPCFQIVPEQRNRTIDTPNMTQAPSAQAEPMWRWMTDPWTYAIAEDTTAMTNLDALRGNPVTEACRWEQDYWELFAGAGPDVSESDARLVPIGCLLATDPSLEPVSRLEIGAGLWRAGAAEGWQVWRPDEAK